MQTSYGQRLLGDTCTGEAAIPDIKGRFQKAEMVAAMTFAERAPPGTLLGTRSWKPIVIHISKINGEVTKK